MTSPIVASRRAALHRAQSHGRLSSAAAAVFDSTGVLWAEAVGEQPEVDLQYRIGSITKTLTAVLVLQAVRAGQISLSTPVCEVIGEHGYGAATVSELLSHTSGMQSEPVGPWWERSPGTDLATLLTTNDGSGRVSGPGEYHYSNLGYAFLGRIAEVVHGAPWRELVQKNLLDPLAMTRTSYEPQEGAAQGWSIDHFSQVRSPEPGHDTGAMAPAGQLWSTVTDLARWGQFLVAGHPDVLDPATMAAMRAHVAPAHGLGLQLEGPADRVVVGHSGSMPGFMAALFVDPVTGEGATFLCNGTTGITQPVVARELLGHLPVPLDVPAPWQPTAAVPPEAAGVPGLWFWGNSAQEFRWNRDGLEIHSLATRRLTDRFELSDGAWRGTSGYHRGERLHITRDPHGRVLEMECATFRYTATAYPQGS